MRAGVGVVLLSLAIAADGGQTESPNAERLLTRLAIDTAPDGDVAPILIVIDKVPQVAIYDRFRLVALAARAALRAGHPLDPDHPPPDLLLPRTVILGFARSPLGGDAPQPLEIRLSDRNARAVTRLGVLKAADLAAALPGVQVPPLTLAVAFGIPTLRPSDRIAVVFNDRPGPGMSGVPIGGMTLGRQPGTLTTGVSITPPKAKLETPAEPPPGVTIVPGRNVVRIEGVLDLAGNVRYARALDGPAELHAAAVATVAAWRYEPAKMWATPVPLVMQASVTFLPGSAHTPPVFSPPFVRH